MTKIPGLGLSKGGGIFFERKKGGLRVFWEKKRGRRLFLEEKKGGKDFFWRKKRGANSFFNCKINILIFTKIHFLAQEIIILEKCDCQEFAGI